MPRTWKRTSLKGNWTEKTLKDAFNFIDEGHSISAASRLFQIPFSTLQERRSKKNVANPVLGCTATFSPDRECALAVRIKQLSDLFYGITAQQVRKVAYKFAEKKTKFPINFHSPKKWQEETGSMGS